MPRIVPLIESLEKHVVDRVLFPEKYWPTRCPNPKCGLTGLWYHGTYVRKGDRDSGKLNPIPIDRYRCGRKEGCGKTCSRLPSCLPPRRWWDWAKQVAVLTVLLADGSVRKAALETGRARSTVARWWGWLSQEHTRYAFHLLTHSSEWGRTGTWQAFWQRAMTDQPLRELMASLDAQGLVVP